MANTIKIKRSAVQGKVPTTGDLQLGELALNTYDGKLYTLKNDGTATVIQIGATATTPNSITFNNGGTGGVSGSTFDGNTALTVSFNTIGALSSSTTSTQSGYFGDVFLYDDSTPSHYLQITNSANLTAARSLSINVNDANRVVSLSGNLTVSATATVSGTNTGDQTITLTGDVTGSGTGSFAATLANSGVAAGTYNNSATSITPFTVDAKGRLTGVGTAVTITPSFASITSKPTTLSGYGITDALSNSTASTQNAYFGDIFLYDDNTPSHYLQITNSANLTAARSLSINVNDANRTISLLGDLTLASSFTTAGAFALTLTATAATNVTLPTSGTLAVNNQTMHVGTTALAINRASAAQALTGITSIDGSAATLTTTRTLWGQNFNGSANVTGSLTSVGDITGTGAVTLTATSATLNLTATGANIVAINTNGSQRAQIDSTGRLLVGTTTARTSVFGNIGYVQVEGDSRTIQITHNGANSFCNAFTFIKTRGTGVQTVQLGDSLGLISWQGTNGSTYIEGAQIIADIDDTLATGGMPTKLSFRTTSWGSTTALDRIVIRSSGNVGVGTTNPAYKLEVNGSFAATTKSFVIPHPTKEGYKLRYGSLEGPENGIYVRGRSKDFTIELPEYWVKLANSDSITVSLTPIGKTQTLWVKDIKDNKVYIGSKCTNVEYFYTIFAERADVEKLQIEVEA